MPRKTGKLNVNKTMLIVVEGETEQIYFSRMKAHEKFTGITINPMLAKHSDIKTILTTAINQYKEKLYDFIWVVFDRDTLVSQQGLEKNLVTLLERAKKLNIKFADSMPCFEIWFLLHYAMPKKNYSDQDALIKELKGKLPAYTKDNEWLSKNDIYEILKPMKNTAVDNASILRQKDYGKTDSSCNVDLLICEINNLNVKS